MQQMTIEQTNQNTMYSQALLILSPLNRREF